LQRLSYRLGKDFQMSIKRSVEDLPYAKPRQGVPPAAQPVVVHRLAEAWFDEYVEKGNLDYLAAIPELPYRASMAGTRCDRQMWYKLTSADATNPPTLSGYWRMGLGSMVHDALQATLTAEFVGDTDDRLVKWEVEVDVDLRTIGIQGSAHADLVRYKRATIDDEWQADLVVELKTVGGFAFKMAVSSMKGPPQGPKYGHVVQGALAAAGLGASKLAIGYLSMENISASMAHTVNTDLDKFCAEWQYRMEDMADVVEAERIRITRILKQVDAEILPIRSIDDPLEVSAGAVIVDFPPKRKARWQVVVNDTIIDTGDYWACDYCDFKDRCVADGPGDVVTTEAEF
jgi:hypothetical protein